MIQSIIKTVLEHVSEDRLMETVRLVAQHHRIQASQGFRDAANALVERAKAYGISADVDSYPAAYGIQYLTMGAFPEWNCRAAHCRLLTPETIELAAYDADPISVMQKSFPYQGKPLEIVLMDRGSRMEMYDDVDLQGNLLFIREDFNAYLWAVAQRGACGFLSDYVVEVPGARSRDDQMDVRKYTSFWWEAQPETKPFGFVITPRMGDRLAALCHSSPAPLRAECLIDAEFADGTLENAVLELPGETNEEVWLVAHLCHPKPSANDNASGVSAALEALRVIQTLTSDGFLPPLKRTLKVLLVPEFTGLYAHLSRVSDTQIVKGALNLDMVGGKQSLGYGPLTLSGLSCACPSVVFDLAKLILETLRHELQGFSETTFVPGFNSCTCGFTAGSDHFILQDPTVGIPAPMLGQWPDLFYHTSGDTPDVISPRLLKQSTALAAAYGYILSAMDLPQLEEILLHAAASMAEKLVDIRCGETPENRTGDNRFITAYYVQCAQNAAALVPGSDTLIGDAIRRLQAMSAAVTDGLPPSGISHCDNRIPKRSYRAPVSKLAAYTKGNAELQKAVEDYQTLAKDKHRDGHVTEILIQYYIDGRRTVDEIVSRVLFETGGGSRDAVIKYIETLSALGLCVL